MSMLAYFTKAFLIGFAIAAPIGPIGMFCIKKTLELGFIGAAAVGIGASLADGVYALFASAGMTLVIQFLSNQAYLIKIIGGITLIWLGIKDCNQPLVLASDMCFKRKEFITLTIQTFFLTLTNPLTIMSFLAVFASLADPTVTVQKALWCTVGVALGGITWWLILGKITVFTKSYLSDSWLKRIRLSSALILVLFGIYAGTSGVLEKI